ncbi:creatininase [Terrihabitans soli]|uniref:Creatininase n=1 Tax=Terrihabitans soli TaxID=708113 RepID=A0A6S6QP97_9HYPH|nr:creatininase family protein [Terrihabitans soli]BCJ89747.1 creatininase [Terrihabitans soli]
MSFSGRFWADLTWPEIADADTSSWIAVLPVAAIEQHGPHLPLSTDRDIMQGYLARIMAQVPAEMPVSFLPVQNVGLSPEHRDFPGTLTLSPETALSVWTELGGSVARAGVKKLVLLSSHGGNTGLLEIVARELRARHSMLAVTASFSRLGYPDGLFSREEIAHGIHGGEIETSLMLAFAPQKVRQDRLDEFPAETIRMEHEFKHLRAARPAGFGWLTQDLNPQGAIGNAKAANAIKGAQAAEHGVHAFVELLQDMTSFPLERLRSGPLG